MSSQYYSNSQAPVYAAGLNDDKLSYQYQAVGATEEVDRMSKVAAVNKRIKRRIRILRAVQRVINLFISIAVLGIMLNTYFTFTNHRTAKANNGSTIAIYPLQPVTWPTFMMIATGGASLIFNIAILISYISGIGMANRVSNYAGYWGYLIHVVNFVVWLATTTTFKMLQGAPDQVPPPSDLWGWTCSNAVDELQQEVTGLVNFDLQCNTQNISFIVSLVNASLEILSIAIGIYAMRRMMLKKKLTKMESRQNSGIATAY